jgi:hypothetical protein
MTNTLAYKYAEVTRRGTSAAQMAHSKLSDNIIGRRIAAGRHHLATPCSFITTILPTDPVARLNPPYLGTKNLPAPLLPYQSDFCLTLGRSFFQASRPVGARTVVEGNRGMINKY